MAFSHPIALAIPPDLNSISNAHKTKVPALIISAKKDEIVPAKLQQRVIQAYSGPKRLVYLPEAGHNYFPFPSQNQELERGIEWLMDTIKK
ncbi:MAG: alpha/beta hydrolase [Candidatus Caenarcaniphilales bacterium]|nr:alpha/beta hydrolase [Candidatus Caenarcaniphilales bacterium]